MRDGPEKQECSVNQPSSAVQYYYAGRGAKGANETRAPGHESIVRVKSSNEEIRYQRSRFSTRLVENRLYTSGHSWLEREEAGVWRIGFTKFAVRMLGEIVEFGFEKQVGNAVETGEVIGWVEGFKAVTDVFAPMTGEFAGTNPLLDEDVAVLTTKMYTTGWLFRIQGEPAADCLDVHGYVELLDTTIDKMLGQRHE